MTDTSWETFLAEDEEYKKLSSGRTELEEHMKKYECTVREIEWKILTNIEAVDILQTKLFDMEHETNLDQARYERLQGFISQLEEDRFDLMDEAGLAARHRRDMKGQHQRLNDQCGDRWKIVRQLFDGA